MTFKRKFTVLVISFFLSVALLFLFVFLWQSAKGGCPNLFGDVSSDACSFRDYIGWIIALTISTFGMSILIPTVIFYVVGRYIFKRTNQEELVNTARQSGFKSELIIVGLIIGTLILFLIFVKTFVL